MKYSNFPFSHLNTADWLVYGSAAARAHTQNAKCAVDMLMAQTLRDAEENGAIKRVEWSQRHRNGSLMAEITHQRSSEFKLMLNAGNVIYTGNYRITAGDCSGAIKSHLFYEAAH